MTGSDDGCSAFKVELHQHRAIVRGVLVELEKTELDIFLSVDLIERSFHPMSGKYYKPEIRSGISLPELLSNVGTATHTNNFPLFACNALHTNFVRGNGFIIRDGRLVCKPPGAIGLDGTRFKPLEGSYTAIILHPSTIQITRIQIINGQLIDPVPHQMAISGPLIVKDGENVAGLIPFRPTPMGQTLGDEINFPPNAPEGRSSFTVFGITNKQELMISSVFAGEEMQITAPLSVRLFSSRPEEGLTLVELADLMIELDMRAAILGGGSADTQQYICGQEIWVASARSQTFRPQAKALGPFGHLRGLGAILTIKPK